MLKKIMNELSYMDKLNFQLEENKENMRRSIAACEKAGIDTTYTMGQAIKDFVSKFDLHDYDDTDLRNDFHDAMHITSNAATPSARNEAIAGITEQVLLREPYNGDLNHQLNQSKHNAHHKHLIIGLRKFNPCGHEDFEKPAPPASLKSALDLAYERLEITAKTQEEHQSVNEKTLTQIYKQALQTDDFFRKMTGDRAVYQLSSQELQNMPIAFFGIEKAHIKQTQDDEKLEFQTISMQKREKVIQNLDDKNIILHTINDLKTADELPLPNRQSPDLPTQHSDLSNPTAE